MILRSRQISFLLSVTFILVGCGGNKKTPSYNPAVGPFDEDGNYIEAWADNPPKRGKRSREPEPEPEPRVVDRPKPVAKPRPVTTARVTPKPKPRPVVKPKPAVTKPRTIRHTVKKGDTLYSLAKKYGTSVSAIQKANGLKGSTIQTGKSYLIPR